MIFVAGRLFLNRQGSFLRHFGQWNYATNQIAVFYHVMTNLYKSLITIMIFSNAKGLQNNNYNMIGLCKLGNITDYIYILIFERRIEVTLPSVADKIICMPTHSLHHIVYIFKLYIISMS